MTFDFLWALLVLRPVDVHETCVGRSVVVGAHADGIGKAR